MYIGKPGNMWVLTFIGYQDNGLVPCHSSKMVSCFVHIIMNIMGLNTVFYGSQSITIFILIEAQVTYLWSMRTPSRRLLCTFDMILVIIGSLLAIRYVPGSLCFISHTKPEISQFSKRFWYHLVDSNISKPPSGC